jgi:7,8-dihydroneopterin aldolase/epimerase/oxygenase
VSDTHDRIELRGLRAHGRHGVLPHERRDGQLFVVDVALHVDLSPAGRSDDRADTVDYGALAKKLEAVVTGEPVDLIEALADRLAAVCLSDPRVRAAEVVVHKPQAPVGVPVDDVVVTIRREAP